jgi:hypothetical protein
MKDAEYLPVMRTHPWRPSSETAPAGRTIRRKFVPGNPVTRAIGCRNFAATSVNSKWEIVAGFRYRPRRAP